MQMQSKTKILFTIFAKISILHEWKGSEYASELASKGKDV